MPEMLPDCSLCPPTRGVILPNDFWTLVLNENQATLGRVFFALNRHETDVAQLTDAEVASLWMFVRETKTALAALFAPDHFNYMFLMNLTPHVHFHIFPRYAQPREFAGQSFADSQFGDHYDPHESRALDSNAEEALITAIRHALTQPTHSPNRSAQ
jgi:diadenosine tetraphosphate (Ap4A) HIT family hydrolase